MFEAAKLSYTNYVNQNFVGRNGLINTQDIVGKVDSPSNTFSQQVVQHDMLISDIIQNYYNEVHSNCKHTPVATNDPRLHGNDDDDDEDTSGQMHKEATQHLCENDDWLDYPTRFYTQFRVLSNRNFREARSRMLSKLNWFQTIGLSLMTGAIWFDIPRTEENLHDLQGWMFFSQTYWMLFALFGALNSCM